MVMVQTQLKTKPRHILLKLNSKNKWSEPLAMFMLYYAVLAVLPRAGVGELHAALSFLCGGSL